MDVVDSLRKLKEKINRKKKKKIHRKKKKEEKAEIGNSLSAEAGIDCCKLLYFFQNFQFLVRMSFLFTPQIMHVSHLCVVCIIWGLKILAVSR